MIYILTTVFNFHDQNILLGIYTKKQKQTALFFHKWRICFGFYPFFINQFFLTVKKVTAHFSSANRASSIIFYIYFSPNLFQKWNNNPLLAANGSVVLVARHSLLKCPYKFKLSDATCYHQLENFLSIYCTYKFNAIFYFYNIYFYGSNFSCLRWNSCTHPYFYFFLNNFQNPRFFIQKISA